MRLEIFKQYLVKKGQRMTKERNAILQEAFSCDGHFDTETLYMDMKKRGMKASRASVYRTLNLLFECGLVAKVSKSEHGTIYEKALGRQHHDHMVCMNCGSVIEFYSESLERLQEEICRERGFSGKSHTLEIRGYCEECSKVGSDSEGESVHV